MKRKLRMGMVGGGPDAFIGSIHRKAANLDGMIELVCGAFSSNPERSRAAGRSIGLSPHRVYDTFENMILQEARLSADLRMDFISIVTPNHLHFMPAKMALENGFHVIMDKPMTLNLVEAIKLREIAKRTKLVVALMHTYTGYPMVKEARHLVASGKLGRIRKVYVEYTQGWMANPIERSGHKQATWRTDPKRSGAGGAIGDIGTHAANLVEYISNSLITEVCAQLNRVVEGRKLDDDGAMLLSFANGASGVLVASQIAAGEENNLTIRVFGEKGGLEWHQEEPNSLFLKWPDRPKEIYRAGWDYLSPATKESTRTPSGHPEGFLEAFATIYTNFAGAVNAHKSGKPMKSSAYDFPSADEGVRGMAFIEAAVRSSNSKQKWIKVN